MAQQMPLGTLLNSDLWCSQSTTLQNRMDAADQMRRMIGPDYAHIPVTLLQRPTTLSSNTLVYHHWTGVNTPMVFGRCGQCRKPTLMSPKNLLLMYDVQGGMYAVFCSDHCRAQCQVDVSRTNAEFLVQTVAPLVQSLQPPTLPGQQLPPLLSLPATQRQQPSPSRRQQPKPRFTAVQILWGTPPPPKQSGAPRLVKNPFTMPVSTPPWIAPAQLPLAQSAAVPECAMQEVAAVQERPMVATNTVFSVDDLLVPCQYYALTPDGRAVPMTQ